jgi:hypothetical protein
MPEMTTEQLVAGCHEFVKQQTEWQEAVSNIPQEALQEPVRITQEWTGSLTITPDAVRDILQSNNEE